MKQFEVGKTYKTTHLKIRPELTTTMTVTARTEKTLRIRTFGGVRQVKVWHNTCDGCEECTAPEGYAAFEAINEVEK